MKTLLHPKTGSPRHCAGFTLMETMISTWIFCIIFTGILIAIQIFGLRVYTLGATKLSATSSALKVLGQIRDDIREAKTVNVGNLATVATPATFTLTGNSNKNTGNALQVFPGTNANVFTVYYLDNSGATNYLKMASTVDGTAFNTPVTLASYVTNLVVFDAEDCRGNILTNDANNRIIRMELDFYQWEYPIGVIGGVGLNAYDFYRLTTKITRRQID
jgi:Tfp pilus assembly protein PilV